MTILAALGSLLLAVSAPPAATGQVVGADGAPIAGAEVCAVKEGEPDRCVTTDEKGFYRMENPTLRNLLIQATGYKAQSVIAAPQDTPIVLQKAAGLLVRVVDAATGEPIAKGSVSIDLPSGRRVGSPVPFNRAGVKLSNLAPGDTMVRAEADGYGPSGPIAVELVGGQQKELVVRLTRSASK